MRFGLIVALLSVVSLRGPQEAMAEKTQQAKSVGDPDPANDTPQGGELAKAIEKLKGRGPSILKFPKGTRIAFCDKHFRYAAVTGDLVRVSQPPTDTDRGFHLVLDRIKGSTVTGMAISPDGRFVGFSTKGKITLWNAETGKQIAELHQGEQPRHIQFSPSGRVLFAAIGETEGHLWDGQTGKSIATLKRQGDVITMARFNKAETQVLSGAKDGLVSLWEVSTGKRFHTLKHGGAITTVGFSPDERSILTASTGERPDENAVKVWDASTGKLRFELEHTSGVKASFLADGKQIVSVSRDTITWWHGNDGKKLNELTFQGITQKDARFVPDRQHLIVLYQQQAILWDLFDQKPINKFKNVGESVYDQFSSDLREGYRTFYSLNSKGAFKFWAIEAKKRRR